MIIAQQSIEVRDPSARAMAKSYRGYATSSGPVSLSGTGEQPILLLSNPSDAPTPLSVLLSRVVEFTSGHVGTFRVYSNPTVSANGTVVDVNPLRLNANSPASAAAAYKSPTVSANGALLATLGAGNLPAETEEPFTIDAGNALLVTAQGLLADSVGVDLAFAEQ